MRSWQDLWIELREVAWLASVVSGLSIAGVGLAVALVMALNGWDGAIAPALGRI
jgi:hypothetical protein